MPIDAPHVRPGIPFVGVDFSAYAMEEVIALLQARRETSGFFTVVTPNVQHIVMLNRPAGDAGLRAYREAYDASDLRLCDSRILALLARLCGLHLPVVPGSDLTAALFASVFKAGDRVAIIGGHAQTLNRLEMHFPGPDYIQHVPPFGLLANPAAMQAAADFVRETGAAFTLFAVGSPQSEILAHRCAQSGAIRGVGLSIGASIDFLVGDQIRAPRYVQRLGLEWAHRLLSDPRRLWRRYLVEGPKIFLITARWAMRR
jgi:exopolysaccharide biosynthesis WecB/TagA/CpsF family protein